VPEPGGHIGPQKEVNTLLKDEAVQAGLEIGADLGGAGAIAALSPEGKDLVDAETKAKFGELENLLALLNDKIKGDDPAYVSKTALTTAITGAEAAKTGVEGTHGGLRYGNQGGDTNRRTKYNASTNGNHYWLASPNSWNAAQFIFIYADGGSVASYSSSTALGCVGRTSNAEWGQNTSFRIVHGYLLIYEKRLRAHINIYPLWENSPFRARPYRACCWGRTAVIDRFD
jgi:hypothetical protein